MKAAAILLSLLLVGCRHPSNPHAYPLNARFQKVWPGKSDIEWFYSAKGKREAQVLKEYGTPKEVQKMSDGVARWRYPWLAVAELRMKDGIVIGAFYDAGY